MTGDDEAGIADFEGRVAIVTGAGGGVGGAIAIELARRGCAVVVNDLGVNVAGTGAGDTDAEATVRRIRAAGGTAIADRSSVTDAAAVQALARRAVSELGSVDVLVNTAGIVFGGGLQQATQPEWDRLLDVHVGGHLNCMQAVLPYMSEHRYGRIVNVTSGAGLQRVAVETSVYGTAKRAIAALTWTLGHRSPPGVTINALSPIALTRMVTGAASAARAGATPSTNGTDEAAPSNALDFAHMPRPEALAPVAAFMCSERCGWLNGQIVFTNGSEASVVAGPRLIEAVHIDPSSAGGGVDLADAVRKALIPAARAGMTTGGSMPRIARSDTSGGREER